MLDEIIGDYAEKFQKASAAGDYSRTLSLIGELNQEFRNNPPSVEEIVQHLNDVYATKALPRSQFVFMAAWSNLDPTYSNVLCKILDAEECKAAHEPALDLLCEIGTAQGVPTLIKAIGYRWDYDRWFDVPRKALRALARIQTPQACAAVQAAAASPIEEIREEARTLLAEI